MTCVNWSAYNYCVTKQKNRLIITKYKNIFPFFNNCAWNWVRENILNFAVMLIRWKSKDKNSNSSSGSKKKRKGREGGKWKRLIFNFCSKKKVEKCYSTGKRIFFFIEMQQQWKYDSLNEFHLVNIYNRRI